MRPGSREEFVTREEYEEEVDPAVLLAWKYDPSTVQTYITRPISRYICRRSPPSHLAPPSLVFRLTETYQR